MGYIKSEDLPQNERVYLRQNLFGDWVVVHPLKNEDGSINKFNLFFGSKSNLAFLIFILILLGIAYLGVQDLIANYKKVADDPCSFCVDCQIQTDKVINQINSKVKYVNISIPF